MLSSESEADCQSGDDDDFVCTPELPSAKVDIRTPTRARKSAVKQIVSPNVAAALDRTKISDRKAAMVLSSAAESLGQDAVEFSISRSTTRRRRITSRKQMAAEIMMKFNPLVPIVVHWDGKLLPDLTGHESVDRLPVVATGNKVQQLLGVPKLASGTGQAMAAAVCEILQAWSLTDKVAGMRFDTTASNTGHKNGACPLIEQLLRKQLLYFACRHHIFELVLETVFSVQMKPSSSPDIFIFKRFQSQWSFIDTTDYRTVVDDEYAVDAVRNVKDHIIAFAEEQLSTHLPRDDYRELLEITILFQGGTPSRGIHIMAPGALHKARWMAKAIYAIKIWMFAKQFKLTKAEDSALRDVAIFVSSLYVKAWFQHLRQICGFSKMSVNTNP